MWNRKQKRAVSLAYQQTELNDEFSSLESLLDLHRKLSEVLQYISDSKTQSQMDKVQQEIRLKIRNLIDRGTNLVELYERFGATLFKGKLLDAQKTIEEAQAKDDDHGIVDLVNEDAYVRDRLKAHGEQNAREMKMDYDYLKQNQPKLKKPPKNNVLHKQLHDVVLGALKSRIQKDESAAKEIAVKEVLENIEPHEDLTKAIEDYKTAEKKMYDKLQDNAKVINDKRIEIERYQNTINEQQASKNPDDELIMKKKKEIKRIQETIARRLVDSNKIKRDLELPQRQLEYQESILADRIKDSVENVKDFPVPQRVEDFKQAEEEMKRIDAYDFKKADLRSTNQIKADFEWASRKKKKDDIIDDPLFWQLPIYDMLSLYLDPKLASKKSDFSEQDKENIASKIKQLNKRFEREHGDLAMSDDEAKQYGGLKSLGLLQEYINRLSVIHPVPK